MTSNMFRMAYIECVGIIVINIILRGMCQDRIIISDTDMQEVSDISSTESDMIPQTLLIQMQEVKNVSDLIQRFVSFEDLPLSGPTSTGNGTDGRRALSAAATANIAQPANCQTEQHVIELDKPENGAIIYWPSCVRVRRCGGCCTSNMLACKPLSTSILNVTVLQLLYNHENPNSFESQGTRVVSLEQHDRCSCSCKELPEDCDDDVHDYRSNECRCVCKNTQEASTCSGSKKIWDSRQCVCKCRKVRLCSSGRYFNPLSCRCEVLRQSLAVQGLNPNMTIASVSANVSRSAPQ